MDIFLSPIFLSISGAGFPDCAVPRPVLPNIRSITTAALSLSSRRQFPCAFEVDEQALAPHSAAVTAERAVLRNHTMAWHQ